MAAFNFPDTTGLPTDGTVQHTEDGIVYTWNGVTWTAKGGSSGGGGAIPNLQSVTDVGNTTTNGATFNDTVFIFDSVASTYTGLYKEGSVVVNTDQADPSTYVWRHRYGSITPSVIMADGSATFGGLVGTQGLYAGDIANGPYAYVTTSGTIDLYPNGNNILTGRDTSGNIKTTLKSDGSAEFGSGNIELNADGLIQSTVTAGVNFEARKSTGGVIQLGNADGTASSQLSFSSAGNELEIFPNLVAGTGPKIKTDNDNINIFGGTNNGANQIIIDNDGDILVGGTLPASPNISLNADGSASFAGTVNSPRVNLEGAGTDNILVGYAGSDSTSILRADGKLSLGDLSGGGNIVLNGADGSADFKGKVLVQKEDTSFEARRVSGTKYFEVKHNNYALTLGTTNEISLKGDDGSAEFAGTIGVAGNTAGSVTAINTRIPADTGYGLQITNPDSRSGGMMRCVNSVGTTVFQIGTNGNILSNDLAGSGNRNVQANPGGLLIIESSDARLKTNVTPISDQTEVVKQLNPVTYNWIDTETRGALPELGFIAQEIEELVPEIIGENLDGTKVINYNRLTATLTSALQSALTRIETLEDEVQALKGGN